MAKRRKVASLSSSIISRNVLVVSSEQSLTRNKKLLSFGDTWRCGDVRLYEWDAGFERSALMLPDEPPVGEQTNHTLIVASMIVNDFVLHRGISLSIEVYRCLSRYIAVYHVVGE